MTSRAARVDRLGGDTRAGRARRRRAGPRAAPRSSRRNVGGRLAEGVHAGAVRAVALGASCRRCRRRRRRPPRAPGRRPRGAGDAPLGPEPTMTKSTVSWPSSRIAAAMSRPTSRSVRPGPQELGHPGVHPVDGLAGPAQRVDLVGGLAHPQLAEHVGRRGSARRRAGRPGTAAPARPTSGWPAPTRPGVPEAGGDRRRTGRRSRPSRRPRCPARAPATPARRAPRGPAPRRNGVAVGGQHQAGEPLQRERVVAGESAGPGPGVTSRASRPAAAAALRACDRRSGEARWPSYRQSRRTPGGDRRRRVVGAGLAGSDGRDRGPRQAAAARHALAVLPGVLRGARTR